MCYAFYTLDVEHLRSYANMQLRILYPTT